MDVSALRRAAEDVLIVLAITTVAFVVNPLLALASAILALIYVRGSKRRLAVMAVAVVVVLAVAAGLALVNGADGHSVTSGSSGPIPLN